MLRMNRNRHIKKFHTPASSSNSSPIFNDNYENGIEEIGKDKLLINLKINREKKPKCEICPICTKGYTSMSNLRQHLIQIHKISPDNFASTALKLKRKDHNEIRRCKTCGMIFTDKNLFKVHEQKHSSTIHQIEYRPTLEEELNSM